MTNEKSFDEQFPSLKYCPVTMISGLLADATLLRIGSKEFQYELQKTLTEDFDFAIPLRAIRQHCVDKQNIHKLPDDADYLIYLPDNSEEAIGQLAIEQLADSMKHFQRKHKILLSTKPIKEVVEVIDKQKVRDEEEKLKSLIMGHIHPDATINLNQTTIVKFRHYVEELFNYRKKELGL